MEAFALTALRAYPLYGLEYCDLSDIRVLGIDEIQYSGGHKHLTLVYQIDAGCRR